MVPTVVWGHPSGSWASEGRLAVPGVWAAEGWGTGGLPGTSVSWADGCGPRGACGCERAGPHLCSVGRSVFRPGRPFPFFFLTVAVTCLGNHLELFIVNYKNFYFLL